MRSYLGGSGIVESEHPYKNNYAAERVQTWIVSTKCPYIRLTFELFETEDPYDYVEILAPDGRLLHKLSGSWTKPLLIRYSSFSLKLKSDMSEVRHGFKIKWRCGGFRFKRTSHYSNILYKTLHAYRVTFFSSKIYGKF